MSPVDTGEKINGKTHNDYRHLIVGTKLAQNTGTKLTDCQSVERLKI